MGLFDNLNSTVKGAMGQLETAMGPAILSKFLGGTNLGSITGLVEKLRAAGLENQVASWLGNGSNLPVSPAELKSALGAETLQQLARSANLPIDGLLAALSQHLPQVVDSMSPNGSLPDRPGEPEVGTSLDQQSGLEDIK